MSNKKRKNGKLALFIVIIVAVTSFMLSLAQSVFVTETTKDELRNDAREEYAEFTKGYAMVVKNKIEEYIASLEYYVNADILDETTDSEEIRAWLIAHADKRPEKFDYVAWVDTEANFYSDKDTQTNVKERDYFKAIMVDGGDLFIDNPVTSKTTGKTIIHISKAVNKDGENIGFFCGVVQIENVSAIFDDVNLGDLGFAVMYGADGFMISTTTDDAEVLAEMEAMQAKRPEMYEKITSSWGQKTQIIDTVFNADNEEHLMISIPIEYTPWTLLAMLEADEIYEAATNVSKKLIVTGILLTVFTILIVGILVFFSIKPLGVVEKTILGIASGDADLTQRINLNSNNEIGRVVDGFNQFASKLQTIIATMKDSKEQLVNAGELLQSSTEDTTSAITQIISNIDSMNGQVGLQTESVHQTAGAVNQIASNIESLNRMIESQSSSVTEASAAVEEMIGNINSVNTSVQKMASAFAELEQKAVIGVQKQNDVNAKIEEIETESQALQEANAVISGIAEQTNLLAMNAAIEAAHAGEAGKGFSVVADEIRKLSEDSGQQSQTIGNQLSKITGTIEEIVNASQIASDAFNEVSAGINSTNNLVREITNAMLEQNEGSKQIAIALNSMNDTSNEVKTSSFEMAEGNKAILDEVKRLQDATFQIKDGMDEMSAGARKINETGAALSDLSSQMKESIQNIGAQVDQFKV